MEKDKKPGIESGMLYLFGDPKDYLFNRFKEFLKQQFKKGEKP